MKSPNKTPNSLFYIYFVDQFTDTSRYELFLSRIII